MGIPLSSLTAKLGSNVANSDIFLISNSDSSQDNKITHDELSKSFTGLYAKNSNGITIFESTENYGLSISGSNGYVGINDRTPDVSLDVVDNISATNGSGQIRISTPDSGRKIALSISDPNVYYEFSKKPNDKKLYLESSINNGSTFSNLMAIDQSGNFAIHGTTGSLTDKFLVSGDSIQFQNSGNAIYFDPYNTEIKTSATDETLLLNYNNIGDVMIGYKGVYVDNNITTPRIAIGHAIPSYTLHVSGTTLGEVARIQNDEIRCSLGLRNSTDTVYAGISSDKMYLGSINALDYRNITISSNGLFGFGNTNPTYKLDVLANNSSQNTPAHFETTNVQGTTQIVIAANKDTSLDPTANRNSLVTFSRFDGVADTPKWSIGNLYNDSALGILENDCFVFVKNGYFGSVPNVVAKVSTAGDLDIDGSYSTNSNYCKGKFIQTYQTRVTGTDIYFNPITPDSNSNPSGHNSQHAPFALAAFSGSIERVVLFTSDTDAISTPFRFEISSITPTYNAAVPTDFVTGFFISPPSDPTSYPTSGIIGATYFDNINPNILYVKNKANISGSTAFPSGRLIQYRLCKSDGTKPTAVDFTIVSTIAYNIN